MRYRHLSVAIPSLAESENLPFLIESLKAQTFGDFSVYVCVNNPDGWSSSADPWERGCYVDNQKSLCYLDDVAKEYSSLHIVDRSSEGRGWVGKKRGVGWARKTLFDSIVSAHGDDELIVSLDADTGFGNSYLSSVLETMNARPESLCLSVPYYHPLSGDEVSDRAMLRYEIYMRHYILSMLDVAARLKSGNQKFPYAFTALGSAMVFPAWAYRRVGGITPLQGGEDFYLMQKFAKSGTLLLSCDEVVKPQGRISARVPFGTGPAVAKGVDSMDDTYPLYPHEAFEAVAETYSMFPALYDADKETPMTQFLSSQLKSDDLWGALRRNFKTRELFVRSCQERVDGLRILQFVRHYRDRMSHPSSAEAELRYFCNAHGISLPDDFGFSSSPVAVINSVRDRLFDLELSSR